MMKQAQHNSQPAKMNRRGFLRAAAWIGTASYIAPAWGMKGEPQSSESNLSTGAAAVRTTRTLGSGSAALTVSAQGFGCMGLNHHRGQSPDEKSCIRLVHEAIERGVTLFDTAESYGYHTNEILTGKAIKGYTHRICVSTKFGHKFVNGLQVKTEEDSSPANIRRVCENSLRNLGVETLDLFYQHRSDPNTPIEVVAETMQALIREGKIRHWGLCEVNTETIRKAHAICPVTAIQSEYHLMHRAVEENGVLALCEELGIGFVPYSPLNRGFLGGLINEHTRFDPANDNRQSLPRFQPEAIRANLRIVELLNQFGRTRGITPAQIALAWLANKQPFIVSIPGTTKLSHLEENLRATEVTFTPEEMRALESALAEIPVVGSRYDALQESKIQK